MKGVQSVSLRPYAPFPVEALANRSARFVPPVQGSDGWFISVQQTLQSPDASSYLPEYPIRTENDTAGAPAGATSPDPDETVTPTPLTTTLQDPDDPNVDIGTDGVDDPLTVTEPLPETPPSNSPDSPNIAVIIGAVIAVSVLIFAVGLFVLGYRRRRNLRKQVTVKKGNSDTALGQVGGLEGGSVPPGAGKPGTGPPIATHNAPYNAPYYAYGGGLGYEVGGRFSSPEGSLAKSVATRSTASGGTYAPLTWSHYKREDAVVGGGVEQLEVALDAMCGMQAPFCNRFMLHSAANRRVGGQGVVQFGYTAGSDEAVAIKFFLEMRAFEREAVLYKDSRIQQIMPRILAIDENEQGLHRTNYGYTFPPFVIIEQGQSLDEWAKDNANKDFITILQALSHTVRALKQLHSFGYAHRDIKPGNILRRPKQHDWTLIDLGCAATIGSQAGVRYSLQYAAPEVIHAVETGAQTIVANAAVDIWAIGVIAWELLVLTGEQAFPIHSMVEGSREAVIDALAGRAPLPWEAGGPAGAQGGGMHGTARVQELRARLRGLQRTVLLCLERDPEKRPTADALLRRWDHMFDALKTEASRRTHSTVSYTRKSK